MEQLNANIYNIISYKSIIKLCSGNMAILSN